MNQEFERITTDPSVMQGRPCIRGMRITVGLVMNLLANGMPQSEILRNYPDLEEGDIRECLLYAAQMTEERVLPFEDSGRAISG